MIIGVASVTVAMSFVLSSHGGSPALPQRLALSKGKQFFVDPHRGNDSAPGSLRRPWRTIAKAWSTVPQGAVIFVRAGTITTQTVLGGRTSSPRTPITLRAYPREVVSLTDTTGAGSALLVQGSSGVRVRGFRVTNPAGDGIKVTNSSDVEIVGNSVFGCGNQGIIVGGSGSSGQTYSRNVQIWSNRIYANGRGGLAKYQHGIYYGYAGEGDGNVQRGAVNGVIANNVFYDQPTGFHLQIGPEASGLITTNNTFTAASSSDSTAGSAIVIWGSGHQYSTKNVLVVNNALAFNQNHGVRGSGDSTGNSVRNNLAYANRGGDFVPEYTGTSVFTLGPGNITGADPKFVDRIANNFYPQVNSPLVDHADPTYAPPTDLNGRARVGAPDIGAFEQVRRRP